MTTSMFQIIRKISGKQKFEKERNNKRGEIISGQTDKVSYRADVQ